MPILAASVQKATSGRHQKHCTNLHCHTRKIQLWNVLRTCSWRCECWATIHIGNLCRTTIKTSTIVLAAPDEWDRIIGNMWWFPHTRCQVLFWTSSLHARIPLPPSIGFWTTLQFAAGSWQHIPFIQCKLVCGFVICWVMEVATNQNLSTESVGILFNISRQVQIMVSVNLNQKKSQRAGITWIGDVLRRDPWVWRG